MVALAVTLPIIALMVCCGVAACKVHQQATDKASKVGEVQLSRNKASDAGIEIALE
jgi:hypothetical protein